MKFIRKHGKIIPIKRSPKSLAMAEAVSLTQTFKTLRSPTLRENFSKRISMLVKKALE
jgi:hypothetical protein